MRCVECEKTALVFSKDRLMRPMTTTRSMDVTR